MLDLLELLVLLVLPRWLLLSLLLLLFGDCCYRSSLIPSSPHTLLSLVSLSLSLSLPPPPPPPPPFPFPFPFPPPPSPPKVLVDNIDNSNSLKHASDRRERRRQERESAATTREASGGGGRGVGPTGYVSVLSILAKILG